jgi:hypothetical protein
MDKQELSLSKCTMRRGRSLLLRWRTLNFLIKFTFRHMDTVERTTPCWKVICRSMFIRDTNGAIHQSCITAESSKPCRKLEYFRILKIWGIYRKIRRTVKNSEQALCIALCRPIKVSRFIQTPCKASEIHLDQTRNELDVPSFEGPEAFFFVESQQS